MKKIDRKTKERLLKLLEDDLEGAVVLTDSGMGIVGNNLFLLSMISMFIDRVLEDTKLTENEILIAIEYAMLKHTKDENFLSRLKKAFKKGDK